MREIKFRAWDEKSKRMFNVDVLAISPVMWDSGGTGVSLAYQPHIKVMQYTGLKGKNGKEIYEGDLLRHPNGTIAEIRYLNDLTAFVAIYKQNGNTEVDYLDKEIVNKCKVIGNIYENPELLEDRE